MSYAFPYAVRVASELLETYPRACNFLKIITDLSYYDIHRKFVKAFQTNQMKWRALKIMLKQLDRWQFDDIKRLSEVERLEYLKYVMWECEDEALDT